MVKGGAKESKELVALKDKLFIVTGQDSIDTFAAFDAHNFNWKQL